MGVRGQAHLDLSSALFRQIPYTLIAIADVRMELPLQFQPHLLHRRAPARTCACACAHVNGRARAHRERRTLSPGPGTSRGARCTVHFAAPRSAYHEGAQSELQLRRDAEREAIGEEPSLRRNKRRTTATLSQRGRIEGARRQPKVQRRTSFLLFSAYSAFARRHRSSVGGARTTHVGNMERARPKQEQSMCSRGLA
jgi:hypothetical protein